MAHVLNRPERNQTFWKFLFFFLLSTAMIVGALYFDVSIPGKDNEKLREQVSRYKMQARAQEIFVKRMEETKRLFDTLNNPGSNVMYLNVEINSRIKELNDLQDRDSSMYSRLNRNVADIFLRYLETTNNSIKMGELPEKLKECQANYEKTKSDLDKAQENLDVLRRTTNNGF